MAKVKLGSSVASHTSLWRYMSLDKLVNLLEFESLYFSPLSYYERSDPFEGYLPKVAFEVLGKVFSSRNKELEAVYEQLKEMVSRSREGGMSNPVGENLLEQLRMELDSHGDFLKAAYKVIAKGITVNCWHSNPHESEAMWRLYSDNGKGVAIKTSIEALKRSIESVGQDTLVQIGAVKYLDFYDQTISPGDCLVDGHLSPLLKRISFSHENEVRLFTVPNVDFRSPLDFKPRAEIINVDIKGLIEEIYISPFAVEPFVSSVIAICKKYEIDPGIVKFSSLLDGHGDLLGSLVLGD